MRTELFECADERIRRRGENHKSSTLAKCCLKALTISVDLASKRESNYRQPIRMVVSAVYSINRLSSSIPTSNVN